MKKDGQLKLKLLGHVKYIRRYPVKSMKGEDLEQARIESSGIEGDRTYAFIDVNSKNKTFPWMTSRQAHEMLLYDPRFTESGTIQVKCPDGRLFSLTDIEFKDYLERKYGYKLSLKYDRQSHCFDSKPISLIGLDTVRSLGKETLLALDHRRFRANLYVEFEERTPFYEDALVGSTLQIGDSVRIKVVKKDSRCVIPTLDPLTSKSSPIVLETIQKKHGGCAGVYSFVEQEGIVKEGYRVSLV